MEEQLRKDKQGLKTREQKRKAEYAKRIRRIVHENGKSKGTSYVQAEVEKLMHHDEQELLSLWEGWLGMTTKAGGLTRGCAKARREEVEYYARRNKFERFRGFLELISRFEFEFCRRENYFF